MECPSLLATIPEKLTRAPTSNSTSVPGSGTVEMPAGERAGVASAGAERADMPGTKAPMLSPLAPPSKSKITEAPSLITKLLDGDKALSTAARSVPANTLVSPL